jgi:predicted  nucleic acid-binding Zn-ribbon protein
MSIAESALNTARAIIDALKLDPVRRRDRLLRRRGRLSNALMSARTETRKRKLRARIDSLDSRIAKLEQAISERMT